MKILMLENHTVVALLVLLCGCSPREEGRLPNQTAASRLARQESKPSATDEAIREKIAAAMRQHIADTHKELSGNPGYTATAPRWDRLLAAETLAFAVEAAVKGCTTSSQARHPTASRRFPGLHVVVTCLSSIDDQEAMNQLQEGYLKILDRMLIESGYLQGDFDFAHWIFCWDGKQQKIHLSFIPSRKFASSQFHVVLFAQDLMTSAEKKQVNIE